MRKSKSSADQIVRMLREAEQERAAGKTIVEICQRFGISDQTYHRWRAKYGGLDTKEARRVRALEEETSARFINAYADLRIAADSDAVLPMPKNWQSHLAELVAVKRFRSTAQRGRSRRHP